jgi:HK97 gp10 family phage protein
MTVRARIDFKGLEEWLLRLSEAGADVNASAARAINAGQDVALAGMVRRVPKDTHNLELHLVKTAVQQDGNFVYGEVGLIGADAETARYGNAQEYGKANMAAQPYVRPTMDADKRKIRKAMRDSLKADGTL